MVFFYLLCNMIGLGLIRRRVILIIIGIGMDFLSIVICRGAGGGIEGMNVCALCFFNVLVL